MSTYSPRGWRVLQSIASLLITFGATYAIVLRFDPETVTPIGVVMISSLLVFIKEVTDEALQLVLRHQNQARFRKFVVSEIAAINDGLRIHHANAIEYLRLARDVLGLDATPEVLETVDRLEQTYRHWKENHNFEYFSNLPDSRRLELTADFDYLREETSR